MSTQDEAVFHPEPFVFDYLIFNEDFFGTNISNLIEPYLNSNGLIPSEITIYKSDIDHTLKELVGSGTGLFDALMYRFNVAVRDNFIIEEPLHTTDADRNNFIKQNIEAVSLLSLYVLFRGQYPVPGCQIPNFILAFFKPTVDLSEFINCLSSINIKRFPLTWIRGISFRNFPSAFRDRIMMGVAGYRLINCIKRFPVDNDQLSSSDFDLCIKFREWMITTFDRVYWDVFPITKSALCSESCPRLNRNLSQFILTAYKADTLNAFLLKKIIMHIPETDLTVFEWKSWPNQILKFSFPILHS